jgi:hypothetical protein
MKQSLIAVPTAHGFFNRITIKKIGTRGFFCANYYNHLTREFFQYTQ